MQKRKNFKELQQEKIKEDAIMNSVIESNEKRTKYEYTEEQILEAQERKANKQINELYDIKVFPYANNIMFICYYTFSIITFPLLYYGEVQCEKIVAALAFISLLISIVVLIKTESIAKKEMHNENATMIQLNKFTTHTSYLGYMVTSLGYLIPIMDVWRFWFIYIVMILLYIMAIYNYIVKPLIKKYRENNNSDISE